MPATTLVTGGLGFIGSHVVQALLRAGHRVVVIDRVTAGNSADSVLTDEERTAAEVIATAIPPADELARLFRQHGVDQVAHLASPLSSTTESQPGLAVDEMVVPHRAVLDAALAAGVRRVVWASSVGVFGRSSDYPTLPIPNDAPHYPLTVYGAAKSFLERLSSEYTSVHGLDTIGLRFPLVYGPGRQRGGGLFTNRLIESAALGESIVAEGSSDRYDWMYVTDAARSVELALAADRDAVPGAHRRRRGGHGRRRRRPALRLVPRCDASRRARHQRARGRLRPYSVTGGDRLCARDLAPRRSPRHAERGTPPGRAVGGGLRCASSVPT